jgi:hypothetical protein
MKALPLLAIVCAVLFGCEKQDQEDVKAKVEKQYSKEILEIAKRIGFEPEAVAAARSLLPSELKALTEVYLEEVHQSPSYWRLMPARDLAAPYLIAAFERENPFKQNDESSTLRDSPASRALAFLELGVHDELKAHLLRWLKTGDETVCKVIARQLVAFGTDDLLPHVKVLFEHEDMFVSSGARSGALEAIKAGRAESAFKKYVWEHSKELLQAGKPPTMHDPIRLLVAIDEEATKKLLLAPAVMRRDHPLLAEALSTLSRLKSPPDGEFLNSLVADGTLAPAHRKDRIQQAAISGLIVSRDPAASAHVEKILAAPDKFSEDMVLAAWAARFALKGLTPISDSAFETYEKAGCELNGLSHDERDVILMHYLDAEVRNGGFWQWYYNDFGRFGVATRKALEKVGATKHAKVVDEANRLFGRSGPPESREKVQKALDAMSDKNAQKMSDLNDAWYDLPSWALDAATWDWKRQNSNAQQGGAGQPPTAPESK